MPRNRLSVSNCNVYRDSRGGGTAVLVNENISHTHISNDVEDERSIKIFNFRGDRIIVTSKYIKLAANFSQEDCNKLLTTTRNK